MAETSTSTVLPGTNRAIELRGTPACRSATANPTKDAGITTGQTLTGTNNNPVTRIAQPGHSGHTVLGFETSIPTSVGTRYDDAIVTHTTSNVEREPYISPLKIRLRKFVMRASSIVKHSPSDESISRRSVCVIADDQQSILQGEWYIR